MSIYTQYPIRVYPGRSRSLQLFDLNKNIYPIPAGSTAAGKVVDIWNQVIADLSPVVDNAAAGVIRLNLPDTSLVRQYTFRDLSYDIILTTPGGLSKVLPQSSLVVLRSPTESGIPYGTAFPAPAPSPSPSPAPAPAPAPSPSPSPRPLYIHDQTWVDNEGNRFVMTIQTVSGQQFVQLEEVLP
jgi:hypothetical protein